jgi:hypothetical protein
MKPVFIPVCLSLLLAACSPNLDGTILGYAEDYAAVVDGGRMVFYQYRRGWDEAVNGMKIDLPPGWRGVCNWQRSK